MGKRVSVIILNYNGERFLRRLLLSLSKQTFRDFEIIFVDNASTDNSIKILRQSLQQKEFEDLNVKLVLNNQNFGYCAGNNIGAKYSQGEYLVFLNNDTYVSPKWLEELVKVLDEHPSIGVCQSKLLFAKTCKIQTIGNACDLFGRSGPCINDDVVVQGGVLFKGFFYASGAAFIIRREVFDKCRGFDEKLTYGDCDLSWRVRLCGYNIATALRSKCYHFGSYATKRVFPATIQSFNVYYFQRICCYGCTG